MKNDRADFCYACDSHSISREHIPPKCLFPTELPENLRKNLITVPSCEEHNGRKSDDDEFLLASLAGIIGCNDIGLFHKFTKVDRAIRRSGGRLLKKVLRDQEIKSLVMENGDEVDVIWGKPDLERLSRCFDLIGRGLFFHKFGMRFRGKVVCEVVYVPVNDRGRKGYREYVVDQMQKELSISDLKGDNPSVFQWVIGPQDISGGRCGHLIFYGNLSVYLGFIPEEFQDEDFVDLYSLAKTSIKPVYIQKDGKRYRIN